MRKLVFFASITLAIAVFAAWSSIDWAMNERRTYAPNPDSVRQVGHIFMTEEQILLTRVHPPDGTSTIQHWLLSRRNLFPLLYVVAGFAGACAAIWLLLGPAQAIGKVVAWDAIPASVMLSGLAGLIAYLLVKIVARFAGQDVPATLDTLEVFPMLAGVSNTVFYDALPGLLQTMLDGVKSMVVKKGQVIGPILIVAAISLPATRGHAQSVAVASADTAKRRVMYSCFEPRACSCVAFSPKEKAECTQCQSWKETVIDDRMFAALQSLDSSTYKENAGGFLLQSQKQVFGISAADLSKVSVAVAYNDPASHGLRELASDTPISGSLVLFPNFSGVVLNDNGDVAYPSAAFGGRLRIASMDVLRAGATAKIVVPEQASIKKP